LVPTAGAELEVGAAAARREDVTAAEYRFGDWLHATARTAIEPITT
jgi:hypothetical protein